MRQQRLIDRRRAGQHGDLFGLYARHDVDRVEHGLGQHRRSGGEACEHPGLVPRDVKERADDAVAVAGDQPDVVDPVARGAAQRPVAQHGAFGLTRGARSELHVADVVTVDLGEVTPRADCLEQLAPCKLAGNHFAPK